MCKMKKFYEKSELWFTLTLIIIYSVVQSFAVSLNDMIGVGYSANMIFNLLLTVVLFVFIQKNGLMKKYGLCKPTASARKFLWFIPLAVIVSHNLWNGVTIRLPMPDLACYIVYMLCVGFVEEVLFRGLLFEAIAKDNVKSAIIISSVTFGLGHIINMLNGVHDNVLDGVYQVVLAIAVGFLFVVIYYRGGSLLPCIIAHSAIDVLSAFAREEGMTGETKLISGVVFFALLAAYALILTRTLPKRTGAQQIQ